MKKKSHFITERPLADMHADGVRFSESIREALKNQQTISEVKNQQQNNA
ncbi:hypothetical protein GCM10011414_06550 [Croceivirga lutea]|nr:hypothetical protein [Croceivirga lutea]GGG39778.1 hypothetical protein GCM10011414_06550 [Croceivirga lutea]